MKNNKSKKAFNEAVKFIPGGVNSPVRAFKGIGMPPLFIRKASGACITDIDNNTYIDYCLSWGVHILGHNHSVVKKAVKQVLREGTSYGAPTLYETELAKKICKAVPSVEKIRFVSSGTEAVMSAIRLARGFTGRDIIVKFDGCYHGHADHMLVAAGSGVSGLERSTSKGIPKEFLKQTISVPFNDKDSISKVFSVNKGKIAAIIVEPVPANMGVIIPCEGYLEFLRDITKKEGALLIFDEVITGFRWNLGGAQGFFNIKPDITCLGKIIGGGFPVGAFGGRKDIMDLLAPDGPVYQAGTLSGNPVAMAAGIAVIDKISERGFYEKLNRSAASFFSGLTALTAKKNITLSFIGTMFTIFFSGKPVTNHSELKKCDKDAFRKFYISMLANGIYLPPSQSETGFISSSHSSEAISKTLADIEKKLNAF